MPRKPQQPTLEFTWCVRATMELRGIKTLTELKHKLDAVGHDVSLSQLGRLIDGKSQNVNTKTILFLMQVLNCELDGIFETKRVRPRGK